ncbi:MULTISPECIES: RHS repeat-associated core domain-containing protein [unclassified Streptomyces]|uniref:RHS repeat-associated core domain-containing protein n=1 Tax=unclassified Streptomyces TaxID=2593676 RepID=UPI000DC290C3|nr:MULTISPECIES: RHS repeat-associated core domain-containing protein [unclassified Streptomyces]RAJ70638.1 RHS repeat-associated protein [Streptomyces sp. PsTaAH-137]
MRVTAVSLAGFLLTGALAGPVAAAAELELRKLTDTKPVPTDPVKAKGLNPVDHTRGKAYRPDTKARWPKAGKTHLKVPARNHTMDNGRAGDLPLGAGASATKHKRAAVTPTGVDVQVLSQKDSHAAGVNGVLMAVRGTSTKKADSSVRLTIDYSSFAGMYGGDWSSRLTASVLDDCALTSPKAHKCKPGTPLKSTNDPKAQSVSADVPLTAVADDESASGLLAPTKSQTSATGLTAADDVTLVALTAAASGPTGNYGATPLSPSGSWSAGGSSGGFAWSYDMPTPSVPGDLTPDLGLSYSSQSIDGRTAATNNQANWVADGWSLSPGSIERRYVSCEDDKDGGNNPSTKVGDLCWKNDNATLSLGGESSELVKDDKTGVWKKKQDDGTRIERFTNTSLTNGDNDGEYWRVTSSDGTMYYFGRNKMDGWADGKDVTNSVWTVPVYGNHDGEKCHASAFADSWCQQAWRWNLDAVVDPHGDAMVYYWGKESNYYQRNIDSSYKGTMTPYTRGGYLKRIEYGLRSGAYYADPAAKAEFTVAERCLPTETFDCATDKFTKDNAKYWPDVPFDKYCTSSSACEGNSSPSYFTRKRLTGVTTYARDDKGLQKVDTWTLRHQYPATGDGTDPSLWLAGITRTGHVGGTDVSLPEVTTSGIQLPNRVEGAVDEIPPYVRYRVAAIKNETGSTLGVTYSEPDCTATSLPTPSSNSKRCYPVIWSPPDAPAADYKPYQDWFHTYVVTKMLESDNVAGAPTKRTDYRYLDGMAWGKDDDEFTKADQRTWGNRLGYGRVQTLTGDPAEGKQTLSETRYFRGIDGAKVADSTGTEITDHESFAGQTREEATYNGDGGALVEATSYTPWHSAAVATRSRTADKLPEVNAWQTGVKEDQTRTTVSGVSAPQLTKTTRTFDSYGMVDSVSETGDTAKSGDEQCTTTSYTRNTTKNLLNLVAETKSVAKPCGTTPSLPDDLISASRTYYDNATTLTTAPTKGDATREDEQDADGTGYLTTATSKYDAYGRQTQSTDAEGATTNVTFTPTTGRAPTETTTTNALGHTSKEITEPLRGLTTATIDANGKRADMDYDALGHVTKTWDAGWPKADHATQPTAQTTYAITRTKPTVVTTKTLNSSGAYDTSYVFYDGLMRQRETQSAAIGASTAKIVTENLYDTRGLAWKSYSAYYASGAPSATLVTGDDTKVPAANENRFDGAGRTTASLALRFGDETRRTTTEYGGDRTTVIPPQGGTATTTVVDALGRTSEKREYTDAARTKYLTTSYTYEPRGNLDKITGPEDTVWAWKYDHRDRETKSVDPDKGTSTTTYDDDDRPLTSTDARNITLTNKYDDLGRTTELKQGDTVRAAWSYDTVAKGQLASDTRYIDGQAYTNSIDTYDNRYQVTKSTSTLPAGAGSLAGSYSWTFGYNTYTGAQEWTLNPALGNLPSERVTTVYGEGNLPIKTTAGAVTLVNTVNYDVFGRAGRTEYGVLGRKVYDDRVFDEHTGQLTQRTISGDVALRIDDTRYGYDPAGNVTRIAETGGQDAATTYDTQCFATDALQRMTEAWTAKDHADTCTSAPNSSTVGGPDSYWQSYKYDDSGQRTSLVQHATTTGADTINRTYKPAETTAANPHAHALGSITTTGGDDPGTETYTYDDAGNTATRTGGDHPQNLVWDAEGHLQKVTENGKSTEYLYDANGNRMLTKQTDGSTTAYLPAGNELTITSTGAKQATRYYTHNGENIAVRNASGFQFLFADQKGTALLAVAFGTGQAVTRRKQLPFGSARTNTGSTAWPGDRGFLSGTSDPTGYTHLGAREYDPQTGRFLSVDPLFTTDDPAQHNAYQYANNNPVTFSDPTGEAYPECRSGQYNCSTGKSTADVTKVEFGKNYESITRNQGGKPSKNYYTQQATGKKYTYVKGKGVTKYTSSQLSAGEKLQKQREAEYKRYIAWVKAERKKAEAQAESNAKDEGFWGGLRSKVSETVGSASWWRHKGVDVGIGVLATVGTAACIASVVCGGGLFIVGASALFVTGIGAHMAVASPQERQRGGAQYLTRTAKAEGKGIFFGATFGRGAFGAMRNGAKQGTTGAGLTTRQGSDPLFAGIAPRDYGAMGDRLLSHLKSLW